MRARVNIALFSLCAGAFAGGLSGVRWLLASSAALGNPLPISGPHLSFFIPMLLVAIACLCWLQLIRAFFISGKAVVHILLSIIAGLIFYSATQAFYNAAPAAGLSFVLMFILVSLLAFCGAILLHRWRLAIAGILFAVTSVPAARNPYIFTGDYLAAQASVYAPPITLNYYLQVFAFCIVISLAAGAFYILLSRSAALKPLYLSLFVGVTLSLGLSIAQSVAYYSTMMTGQNPTIMLISHLLSWAVFVPAVLLSIREWSTGNHLLLLKIGPAVIALLAGSYCCLSITGYSDYAAINESHPDKAVAYVHFLPNGGVRRTLDLTGSSVRDWRAQYFLTAYPYSAYRPAGLIKAAECAFENWNFDQAVEMTAAYNKDYPFLRGYSDILAALASFSAGDMSPMHSSCSPSSFFAKWRNTQGAQIAANAALRLGLPNKARGYTSAYIDFLHNERPAAWFADAFAYADTNLKKINNCAGSSDNPFNTGKVSLKVVCGSRPVCGAKVILVQPHVDASLTSDSMQFAGAWSIPVWNGIWGVTDSTGKVEIGHVPYGSYDLVVGVGLRSIPLGYVANSRTVGITINRPDNDLGLIQFVPAVRLSHPKEGNTVGEPPVLRWSAYPKAAAYSVTVMKLAASGRDPVMNASQAGGTTCWAKSGIKCPHVRIDTAGFVGDMSGLEKGSNYMWLVYAYSSDGKLLSSSEHYFQLSEPTFVVR